MANRLSPSSRSPRVLGRLRPETDRVFSSPCSRPLHAGSDLRRAVLGVPRLVVRSLARDAAAHDSAISVAPDAGILGRVLVAGWTMCDLLLWKSALLRCIAHVVRVCAKKEVVVPHARRIVAVVADSQSLRYCSTVQLPRKAVRAVDDASVSDSPIAIRVARSRPQPALRSEHGMHRTVLVDMLPKSLREWTRFHRGNLTFSPPLFNEKVATC